MLKSLFKALEASNSVTLSDFGGIMKMGSSYMFNEFLKFNDGKFSKFLQETESLSEQEANDKIDDFIKGIKSDLETKGRFSLNEIGILTKVDGKIKLEKPAVNSEKKETKATPIKKEPKQVEVVAKQEKPLVKEIKKKEVEKTKIKAVKKTSNNLSIDFTVKEAQEKIKSYNDKQEIIDFTKGDKRKTIIEALNQKLKSLNKIDVTELDILESSQIKTNKEKSEKNISIKEGSEKEVKKQVAKESDILKTIVEKEIADKATAPKPKEIKHVPEEEIKKEIVPPAIIKKEVKKTETKEEEDLVALTEGAVKLEKEAKGRKRNKIIFWIALICILSGGGIVGYLKQDYILGLFETSGQIAQKDSSEETKGTEVDNHVIKEEVSTKEEVNPIDEEVVIPEELVLGDSTVPVETEEEIEIEETVIEPVEELRVEKADKGSFYVVVGSFSKEKNALNLVKSLKEEGFNNAKIFQNGNLQSVSLGVFSNSSDAKTALKESGKDGWVKKPR